MNDADATPDMPGRLGVAVQLLAHAGKQAGKDAAKAGGGRGELTPTRLTALAVLADAGPMRLGGFALLHAWTSTYCLSRLRCRNAPPPCSIASRMHGSTPRLSISLIVNTFASSRLRRSRSPWSSDRTPNRASLPWLDRRQLPVVVVEPLARQVERCREDHPVDIPARRGLRRVQIAVCVDPDDTARAVRLRHPDE